VPDKASIGVSTDTPVLGENISVGIITDTPLVIEKQSIGISTDTPFMDEKDVLAKCMTLHNTAMQLKTEFREFKETASKTLNDPSLLESACSLEDTLSAFRRKSEKEIEKIKDAHKKDIEAEKKSQLRLRKEIHALKSGNENVLKMKDEEIFHLKMKCEEVNTYGFTLKMR